MMLPEETEGSMKEKKDRRIDSEKAFWLYTFVRKYIHLIIEKNLASFAASATFFIILSLIPMFILVASIIPFTAITEADLILFFTQMSPDFADAVITVLIEQAFEQPQGLTVVSAAVALWMGSLAMLSLIRGLNFMDDSVDHRNYFLLRGLACFYTVILLAVFLLLFVLIVMGRTIARKLIIAMPALDDLVHAFIWLRYPVAILIGILALQAMYTFIPSIKGKFIRQLPGAVFTSVVWAAFSLLFSVYVNHFNDYSFYGGLAAPVIAMFWLYGCFNIFFVGAFINRFLQPAIGELKQG